MQPLRRSHATSHPISFLHAACFPLLTPNSLNRRYLDTLKTVSPFFPFFPHAWSRAAQRRTCVGAEVSLERGVAGEGAVALAADVAAHPSVHLHVLLQGALRLEPLATQQAENSHVRTCGRGRDPPLSLLASLYHLGTLFSPAAGMLWQQRGPQELQGSGCVFEDCGHPNPAAPGPIKGAPVEGRGLLLPWGQLEAPALGCPNARQLLVNHYIPMHLRELQSSDLVMPRGKGNHESL